jgi:hypothetical protein
MVLPKGLYRLKVYPHAPIGGVFATTKGFEQPIAVAADIPTVYERQIVRTTMLSISYLQLYVLTMTCTHVVECW